MLVASPRGPTSCCLLAVSLLIFILKCLSPLKVLPAGRYSMILDTGLPGDAAANATLSFEKVLVLSTRPSWRTRGLKAAAAYTDLEIEIPEHVQPWATKYMEYYSEGHRLVQEGINPVCTFAYAVTSQGARNVLAWAEQGGDEAFDIRLMKACRPGILNVLTVQPELMHHYTPPHDAGYWSQIEVGDAKGAAGDESVFESKMGRTENILNSARCKVLFESTCAKPFREQF